MEGYRISFNGVNYDKGFEFSQDPGVEIKRNDQDKTIYEKPYFNFTATGDLFDDIDALQKSGDGCELVPVEVFKDGTREWSGSVRLSDVKTRYSIQSGNSKEVEVLDSNYGAWFKSFAKVEVDMANVFDPLCELTDIPARIPIVLFDPEDPPTTFTRYLYRVEDVLSHIVKIITRGNVNFVSDYFSVGAGKDLVIGTGNMIYSDTSSIVPVVSYEDLVEDIKRLYNMWSHHYSEGGVQYVRLEPNDSFYDLSEVIALKNIGEIEQDMKVDKLYATAKVGNSDAPTGNFEGPFRDFEYDTFQEKVVFVGNECAWDSELDLTVSVHVDSDKIWYAWDRGNVDDVYESDLFLIETDGTDAIQYTRGAITYYNDTFLDSSILARYFDGFSPITVYPDSYEDIDYFDSESIAPQTGVGNVSAISGIGSAGEIVYLKDLRVYCETIYDPNTVISDQPYSSIINGSVTGDFTLHNLNYTQWQCETPSSYAFSVSLNLGHTALTASSNAPDVRIEIIHTNSAGTLINQYNSEYTSIEKNTVKQIGYVSPEFSTSVGDKVYAKVTSREFVVFNGNLTFIIFTGSRFNVLGCQNFIGEFVGGTFKSLVTQTKADGYPLEKVKFDSLRANPFQLIRMSSHGRTADTFLQSVKYNLRNGTVNITNIGDELL